KVIPKTFQGADKIQPAEIAMKKAQFLYKDSAGFNFMNLEDFEQFPLSEEAVGEAGQFLQDGEEYDLMYFDGTPINVSLPIKMEFVVKETMPGVKGDTASGGTKPATLDCGITVAVPLFIGEGEKIRINTETLEYVERAN
ncbi:MAG: elongation factor P, partial [Patescibacteria group bacterium]